jgi:uncharacterized membrane protein YeaQ/YmgE (transglycosylase-associated protein family)
MQIGKGMMLLLSLCWLLIGLFVGVLANVAALGPAEWVRGRYVVGVLAALAGGWLGTWVFGSLFGTATAVVVAVLGVVVVPWLILHWRVN